MRCFCRTVLFLLAGMSPCVAVGAVAVGAAEVRYEVRYEPEAGDVRLHVRMRASGLDPSKPVVVELPDHGEWTQVDSLYLRGFTSTPRLKRDAEDPSRWTLDPPAGWNGVLEVSFNIPVSVHGSQPNQAHGLLPWCAVDDAGNPVYTVALSENTLPRIQGLRAAATMAISAPGGSVTGWAGWSGPAAEVELAEGLTDGVMIFGAPQVTSGGPENLTCEVYQFNRGEQIGSAMVHAMVDLAVAYGEMTGRPLERTLRVFVTDKGGGQWTPGGVLMQAGTAQEMAQPHYRQLLAHEVFHQWLGGYARSADSSLVWFQEGFTNYLSLQGAARAGLVPPEWFAQRLLEQEAAARASSAHGKVAFGDPSVGWRDGDGPRETLAYHGGAVLALCLDAELARRGKPRLARMIGDLGRTGEPYTLASIEAWLRAQEMGDFYDSFIARPAELEALGALETAGFVREPAQVTYLGLAVVEGPGLGVITGIDPEGPAARLGIREGDVVTGMWPGRSVAPRLLPAPRKYSFGLTFFDPASEVVHVGIVRGGEELKFDVRPRVEEGGFVLKPGPDRALEAFLKGD